MAHQDPHLANQATAHPSQTQSLMGRILQALRTPHSAQGSHAHSNHATDANVDRCCIRLHDKACDGVRVHQLAKTCGLSITITQVQARRERTVRTVCPDTRLRQGDTIVACGSREDLAAFCEQMGAQSAPLEYLDFADPNKLSRRLKRLTRR
jgi:uncharacterized transporter YbjL